MKLAPGNHKNFRHFPRALPCSSPHLPWPKSPGSTFLFLVHDGDQAREPPDYPHECGENRQYEFRHP